MEFGKASGALLGIAALGGSLIAGAAGAYGVEQVPHVSKESFEAKLAGADLQNWKGLTADQQTAIIKTFNDPRMGPNLTPGEAEQISPDLKVDISQGIDSVPSSSTPTSSHGLAPTARATTYVVNAYYQKNSSQFGVPTGWSRIDYTYVTGHGRVLSDRSCRASYNQFVPGRSINVQTNSWVAGGQGTCIAYWSIGRAWGLGGTDNYQQGMTVNGPGIVRTRGP